MAPVRSVSCCRSIGWVVFALAAQPEHAMMPATKSPVIDDLGWVMSPQTFGVFTSSSRSAQPVQGQVEEEDHARRTQPLPQRPQHGENRPQTRVSERVGKTGSGSTVQ